ncbi:MAG: hypothetical protein LBM73_01190 [Candidatus Nomurabacteria bacterium]|jgi:hypothetical protein|nr:hypothetical protein [Candidatus Nomurabacteria bacterium]
MVDADQYLGGGNTGVKEIETGQERLEAYKNSLADLTSALILAASEWRTSLPNDRDLEPGFVKLDDLPGMLSRQEKASELPTIREQKDPMRAAVGAVRNIILNGRITGQNGEDTTTVSAKLKAIGVSAEVVKENGEAFVEFTLTPSAPSEADMA